MTGQPLKKPAEAGHRALPLEIRVCAGVRELGHATSEACNQGQANPKANAACWEGPCQKPAEGACQAQLIKLETPWLFAARVCQANSKACKHMQAPTGWI